MIVQERSLPMATTVAMLLLTGTAVLDAQDAEHGEVGNTAENKEAGDVRITPIDQTKPFFESTMVLPATPLDRGKGGYSGAKDYVYGNKIAQDDDGVITVLMHVRTGSGFPDMCPGYIAVTQSADLGETWSTPVTVFSLDQGRYTVSGFVYAPKSRQYVGLLTSHIKMRTGFHAAAEMRWLIGHDPERWEVVPFDARSGLMHLGRGNAHGKGHRIQTGPHAGRLLFTTKHFVDGKQVGLAALMSDDDGATWRLGQPFLLKGGNEAGIAELRSGHLYVNVRNKHKSRWRTPRSEALSLDGGETWQQEGPGGPFNTTWTDGDVESYPTRLLPPGRDALMMFVNPTNDGPNRRPNHTVWFSYDDGATWPLYKILWDVRNPAQGEGSASQQQLAVLRDGSIFSMSPVGTDPYKPVNRGLRCWRYNIAYIEDTDKRGSGRMHHRQMDLCFYGAGKEGARMAPSKYNFKGKRLWHSGSARYRFDAPGGKAKIRVRYFDAKDGSARFRLYVAGRKVSEWQGQADDDAWHEHQTSAVELATDDLIMLTGHPEGKDAARFDWIETVMP